MKDFIELTREFIIVDGDGKDNYENIYYRLDDDGGLTWERLLNDNDYIVILGEAGTGKTYELFNRDLILKRRKEYSFFCTIENLANEGLSNSLNTSKERKLFNDWINKENEVGYFFLDSLDEAKLHDLTLSHSLRKLKFGLNEENITRSKIIISCRVSDWRGNLDKEHFEFFLSINETNISNEIQNQENQLFESSDSSIAPGITSNLKTIEKQKKSSSNKIVVVKFAPLNVNQIKILAKTKGINDPENFINDIESTNSWRFCERPQDVLWLADYWKINNKIGSLTELIEHNITKKLEEINPDRPKSSQISNKELKEGVEKLAAAITFCKKSFFILPDKNVSEETRKNSVDPSEILKDWTKEKIQLLLDRSIFDLATYGRVKFHHRDVTEYLCAIWIKKLIDSGIPKHKIQNFVFKNTYEEKVVPQSLKPIAGWLANWNNDFFNLSLEFAPELILDYGDPQALSLAKRKKVLEKFAKRYVNRKRTNLKFDYVSIKRFAHPDLTDTIKKLLDQFKVETDLRSLLINIIYEGNLKNCRDEIEKIALNKNEDPIVRKVAFRTLSKVGTNDQIKTIIEYVIKNNSKIPFEIPSLICEHYFPKRISLGTLINIIKKSKNSYRDTWYGLPDTLRRFIEYSCPKKNLLPLLKELNKLILSPPFISSGESSFVKLNSNFSLLYEAIQEALFKVLPEYKSNDKLNKVIVDAVIILIRSQRIGNYHLKPEKIRKLLKPHSSIIKKLFWMKVNSERKHHPNKHKSYYPYAWRDYYGFWDISDYDQGWLLHDLEAASNSEDRFIILDALLYGCNKSNDKFELLPQIEKICSDEKELMDFINRYKNPPEARTDKFQMKLEREEKRREKDEKEIKQKNNKVILEKIDEIKSGGNFGLIHLIHQYLIHHGTRDYWGQEETQILLKEFEPKIVDAATEGLKKVWMNWSPPLPHESKSRNSIENGVSVGLTGLNILFSEKKSFGFLTKKQAIVASRYGTRELNNFPSWFSSLAIEFPEIVKDTLCKCIEADYKVSINEQYPHDVLAKVSHSELTIINLCSQYVYDLLNKSNPEHIINLNYCLKVLNKCDNLDKKYLCNLAERKTKQSEIDLGFFINWFDFWMSLDFNCAIDYLSTYIVTLDSQKADNIMLELCNVLGGNRFETTLFQISLIKDLLKLKKLLRIVYKHIRRSEDNVHEGSSYTPDKRDIAENFRGYLLNKLVDTPGNETYKILCDLSEDPIFLHSSDTFKYLAIERAEKDSELSAMSTIDFNKFVQSFELEPKTPMELFDIVVDKLWEIKNDIELGDKSIKSIFSEKTDERKIQLYIANELERSSNRIFSVNREEELENFKKPDIRIHSPKIGNPIGIEIKCANRWSFTKLVDALKEQLIKKYLRDIHSQHGILLLANFNSKKWKNPKNNKVYTLSELTDYLNKEAEKVIKNKTQLESIKVIFIDFT